MASTVMGTIQPNTKFNAEKAASKLNLALKGLGCDGRMIIDVLTGHSNSQRQEIKHKYKAMFNADLPAVIKEELGGDFEDACLALLVPHSEYLVECLHEGIKSNEDNAIVDIICTAQPWELKTLTTYYKENYQLDLSQDLVSKLSKDFGELVQARLVLAGDDVTPEEATIPDGTALQLAAQKLYDGGVAKWGTDDNVFMQLISHKNSETIKKIAEVYEVIAGHRLRDAILAEFSGSVKKGLYAIVCSVEDMPAYFAYQLYTSMKGLGTDDKTLIRILVSRSEFDLEVIKVKYKKIYGKELSEDVSGDTSGDYRRLLLKIIQPKSSG